MYFKLLLFLKRSFYLIKSLIKYFKSSILWLFKSREHTSFSVEMSKNNEKMFALQLSNFANIEVSEINQIIELTKKIKLKIPNNKNSKSFADVDFLPKFDYRLLTLIICLTKRIPNIIELGFNQGRLAYLLENYPQFNKDKIGYIGIDKNKRKGALGEAIQNQNFDFIYDDVKKTLPLISKEKITNSILVISTHEDSSEEFIFNYIFNNKLVPKYIISDNVNENSSYLRYIANSKDYSTQFFLFEDRRKFIENFYIGISKKLT